MGGKGSGARFAQQLLEETQELVPQAEKTISEAYTDALSALDKTTSDVLTRGEIDRVKNQGIISESEANQILDVSKAVSEGEATLNQALQREDQKLAQAQERGLADVERGVQEFRPFQQAGQQAVGTLQGILGGQPDIPAIEASPIFQFRQRELEKTLERRQRATGNVLSGLGLQQFGSLTGQLTAEEAARQQQVAQNLAGLGLSAAGQIGGLRQFGAQFRGGLAGQRAQLGAGLSQQLANLQLGGGQALAGLRGASAAQRAQIGQTQSQLAQNLLGTLGTARAGLITERGQQLANLPFIPSQIASRFPIQERSSGLGAILGGIGGIITGVRK